MIEFKNYPVRVQLKLDWIVGWMKKPTCRYNEFRICRCL